MEYSLIKKETIAECKKINECEGKIKSKKSLNIMSSPIWNVKPDKSNLWCQKSESSYSWGMKVTKERHDNFYRFVNVTFVLLSDGYVYSLWKSIELYTFNSAFYVLHQ